MTSPEIPGDRDGFRRVFEAHRDAVHRFLHRLAGNGDDAEDLLQETFTLLWRKRHQFRGEGSLEGYLRQIAYRSYLNARPRLQRGRAMQAIDAGAGSDVAASADAPDESAAQVETRRLLLSRVRRAVDALPDSWREPFVLFRYEGLTSGEVAQTMGLTTKAVEMRLAKATKDLAARLADLKPAFRALAARG
jgi:RNA polymerase sigma-70 factor (ECF subfamily)